jgi:hypothetical protein
MSNFLDALADAESSLSDCGRALSRAAGERPAEIRPGLAHGSVWVRTAAAAALGIARDEASIEALIEATKDPSPDVVAASMWSLGRAGGARAARTLESQLLGPSAGVAAEMLEQNGLVPTGGTALAAFCIGRRDWEGCVRVGAEALDPLACTLSHRRPWMRQRAATALGRLRDLRATESLVAALSDGELGVRRAAARSIEQLGRQPMEYSRRPCERVRLPRSVKPSDEAPIFVVGAQRSGTTLVRLILTSHPSIAIPPEGDFLLDLAGHFERAALASPDGTSFVDQFFEIPKCAEWGLDRRELARRIEQVRPATYADLAAIPYQLYGEMAFGAGKPRWGDKNPYYVLYLDQLLSIYPRARVVVVVRDPRDVTASVLPLHFGPTTAADAVLDWLFAARAANAARSRWGNSVRQVRYEDVATRTEEEALDLCDHVGETFDASMLEFHRINEEACLVPRHRHGWHAGTVKPAFSSSVGRFTRDLLPQEVLVTELFAGSAMVAHGYERRLSSTIFGLPG